ncbi:hypothetical protein SUGI_0604450 [Cryptomeria japonica]|nr:hypothetical protein SUGI_0604450 [Cryptomeria japonica]
MASTSASTSSSHLQQLAPSTSTSTSTPAFLRSYEPPTAKLALQSNKRYHVFLSFRGPDVRNTLVKDLYEALSTAGLNVFLDSEKLEKGEIIGETLERAIGSSIIRIPIFSKGYADSAWCLKEAATMLSTPDLIIPLFYDVDPTHVRYPLNESSPYKQAFTKYYGHPDRHPREEVEGWKDALDEICSRSGWSRDLTQGSKAWLVKTVVNDLMKTFDRVPLQVAKHPVGLDGVKNLLIHKLNLNSVDEVVKFGIWGIGGIVKTTVAKALYNQLYTEFEAASFVANVRASAADARDLTNLQKQILEELINYAGTVYNVDEGISLFKDRLKGKRVLLILDDVDAIGQLNALVGDWLGPGSRVIITTRDKHIRNAVQVPSECIHEMIGLEINESLQLFCWHAFLKASPIPKYKDLSKQIVEACKGHPLSLEVIGSFLYDKQDNEGCWREALQNITNDPEIHKTLYISYSALNDDEKEIFIDIACFFIGEQKSFPIIFWKSLYTKVESAVSNLSMKLLIKINDKGAFDMHDHLRDLGRSIAEEEKQGTRLWKASHLSTLSNNNNVSRLRLKGSNLQRHEMLYRSGIRYLHLQDMRIKDTRDMFFPNLIWLRIENCTFAINKILTKIRNSYRALRKKDDSSSVGNIKQLKIMQLTESNIRSMSPLFSLPGVQQLQHLELTHCETSKKLHDSIGSLSQLQHLHLRECWRLNELPDGIGNLSQLQHLDLIECSRLNELPDSIGNLSQLQHLDLTRCLNLDELPDSIGNLSQLQHLDLTRCWSLNELPDSIGNLSQLQHLDLTYCSSLNELPDSIGNLSQLQHLDLTHCWRLNELPDSIGNLSQLQHLDLTHCWRLNELPDGIGNLSQLQHLDLIECSRFNELPDSIGNLSQLQHLDLTRLNELPDSIGNLSQLQHLDLTQCSSLNELLDSIGNLSQLQHLDLTQCSSLNELPDSIGHLSQLQHLDLTQCSSLNELPDSIGNLSQLQHLNLTEYRCLNELPDSIGNLSQLQHLDLTHCSSLNELLDSIGNLSQLQHLDLTHCSSLNELPDSIGNLSQLQHLDLTHCSSLNELPDSIGNLSQLQHLDLTHCSSLNELPDSIGNLSQLQHLDLRGCDVLLADSISNLSATCNVKRF